MSYYQPGGRGPDPRGLGDLGDPRGTESGRQAFAETGDSAHRHRRRTFVVGAVAAAMVLAGTGVAIAQLVDGPGSGSGSRVTAQERTTAAGSADAGAGAGSAAAAGAGSAAEKGGSPGASSGGGTGAAGSPPASATAGAGSAGSGTGSQGGAGGTGGAGGSAPSPGATPTRVAGPEALSAEDVLYASTIQVGGRTYTRELAAEKSPCWLATTGLLGDILAPDGCTQLLRATWVSGDRAVTVGVGVLPDAAAAQAADAVYAGHVEPLHGGSVPGFCPDQVPCALRHGAYGRFTYYVIAGPVGSAAGAGDPASVAAAEQLGAFAVEALKRQ
ncbi:hypothetical protein [Phaeacidiphilus oryzae]|uniref:hypothetical protein n=1 Tax=Phaeacidiphilus oryzae TaxID=348818 RepID=UPI00068B839C|nr:hypothetical protein [Phaeacidiphilus oryzae]